MAKSHSPGFLKLAELAKSKIKEINPEEVRDRLKNNIKFYLIDVREDHEWEESYIKGAVHLGRGILERDIELKIDDFEADIVLYCGGGYRSALAAASLQTMGYTNVRSMSGGYRAWTDLGFEIVKKDGK